MCRADIQNDVTRRSLIIPLPDETPARAQQLLGNYKPRPRLTESIIKAVYFLLENGARRIAFLPDSPFLKDDIESAIEFMLVMHGISAIGMI